MPFFNDPQKQPGGKGPDQHDAVAIVVGLGAAFLYANPLFDLTHDTFQQIAMKNYGYSMLGTFELAYRIFLHVSIFAVAHVATRLAIAAIITAVGYRLAFAM